MRVWDGGGLQGAGLSSAVYEELPSTDVLTVTVEWGTYSSDRVLRGHRLDNWLHFGASEAEKEQRREEVAAVRHRPVNHPHKDSWTAAPVRCFETFRRPSAVHHYHQLS